MQRERMDYDVVIVGAGPAGLASAIRLKQIAADEAREISICVLEKGSEVGAHILSGAVIEPRALHELFPNWKEEGAPLTTAVTDEKFLVLGKKRAFSLPMWMMMSEAHNKGNYIASLGQLTRWLGERAEALGVEIYPGFAANDILFNEKDEVEGVIAGESGIARDGTRKNTYEPGMELGAKYTLFAEGCRGHLTRRLEEKFQLRQSADPQSYGIGLKEVWEIDPKHHKQGHVTHTVGWPTDNETWGGSFIYHMDNNQISIGFVVGLDYKNPHLSPFDEFQRFKTHPAIRPMLEGGKRLYFGARALNEGGYQAVPELIFPGGALIGCGPGFLNVPKIKGSHTAMKSGMLAAESIADNLAKNEVRPPLLESYPRALKKSWVWKELYRVRNFHPATTKLGMALGVLYGGMELKLTKGKVPWTIRNHTPDYARLKPADKMPKIDYPKPDGVITFDRLSSVFLTNTYHEEDQPSHLRLKDPEIPISHNLPLYDEPAQRYCPAAVYEVVEDKDGKPTFVINAQNCIHCKTCDIKDPAQNIVWVAPEGGGGPNYPNM